MKANPAKCPLCGGNRVPGTTSFTADIGEGVVIVRSVPATACDQCGEDWIEDSAARRVEENVNMAKEKRALVEVTNY